MLTVDVFPFRYEALYIIQDQEDLYTPHHISFLREIECNQTNYTMVYV